MTTPSGWYPDNQQPNVERYWDGQQWTSQTRPAGYGPAPAPAPAPVATASHPPPGYELRRKKPVYKRVWFWLLLIFVLFLALIIALVAAVGSSVDKAVNNQHTIVYKVTSNGKTASITYDALTGGGNLGQEQANDAPLPWSKSISAKGDFSSFSLVAQAGTGASSISCSIAVDGSVKSQKTSTGQFAVVSCAADAS